MAIRQAESGRTSELRRAIQAQPPGAGDARRIARAVLRYEIRHADNMKDRAFIQAIRGCSADTPSALKERARVGDGAGAEAAMVLLELHQLQGAENYARHEDGAWRALSARASENDAVQRRKFFVDPDERVRRAALLAAAAAKDPEDIPQLLEVARLDPDPTTRSRAILTLGHFADPRLSFDLRDFYPKLDEPLRLAVVQAWGTKPLYDAGGRRELQRLTTHETELPVVAAASILSSDAEASISNPAITRLLRFLESGTTDEQRLALMSMPVFHADTSQALVEKAKSEELDIAIIARSRLLQHSKFRESAERQLLEIAHGDDPSLALQAQSALAAGGSSKIRPSLLAELGDKNPMVRKIAARGLVRLGSLDLAAPLLADEDPAVRRSIACQISGAPVLPPESE